MSLETEQNEQQEAIAMAIQMLSKGGKGKKRKKIKDAYHPEDMDAFVAELERLYAESDKENHETDWIPFITGSISCSVQISYAKWYDEDGYALDFTLDDGEPIGMKTIMGREYLKDVLLDLYDERVGNI